jgi:glutamate 5-kinase
MTHGDKLQLDTIKRIVVKVGSAVIAPGGVVDEIALDRICDEIAGLVERDLSVILVSSGAVASGFRALGLNGIPSTIRQKQASAAIGQPALMRGYSERFEARGIATAQVLLTQDDFGNRERFLNIRHTVKTLLAAQVVPIVNENDSVVFDEIKLGDNDKLSALLAATIGADLLLLLSSVPGLLDTEHGEVISQVDDINYARGFVNENLSSGVGTGGMASKLDAASIAAEHGIPAVLTAGPIESLQDPIGQVVQGENLGTMFVAKSRSIGARKSWIAHAASVVGSIVVDQGAARAIVDRGASLLPKGVVRVEGRFDAGAAIDIVDTEGKQLARGLASYSSGEIARLVGRRSSEIESVLGFTYAEEIIHRDDMQLRGSML